MKRDTQALADYAAKGAFDSTPEPPPRADLKRSGPLAFVVQKHAARREHYDLRLELDGVLKSWAVPKGPSLDNTEKRLAVPTEDHPFDYASFEGVIAPKQYGAGQVIVWDCGVYSPDEGQRYSFHDRVEAEQRVRTELAQDKLSFFLRGEKLKGSFALVRLKDGNSWLLIKHKDRFARNAPDVLDNSVSVLSGLTLAELKKPQQLTPLAAQGLFPNGPKQALPAKLAPMLASLADAPFSNAEWLFEPKLDGYRVLAFVDAEKVRLQSRRGIDLTRQFPEIVRALEAQAVSSMVLDGEVIAYDGSGKPSFDALQNRAQLKTERAILQAQRATSCVFYCFDLLHFAGINLRDAPFAARKRYLAQCLLPCEPMQLVTATDGDGEHFYRAALEAGFEGMVAKRKDSRYQAGARSANWIKLKATLSEEFVIGGYTQGKGNRAADFGALLVGHWTHSHELVYAGHVGSGFNEAILKQLKQRFAAVKSKAMPFAEKPTVNAPAVWLKPELVAEIKFAGWTEAHMLRAPVFLRMRDDISASEAKPSSFVHPEEKLLSDPTQSNAEIEQILAQLDNDQPSLTLTLGSDKLALSHLDKVLWPSVQRPKQPALTKRDLLRYLARVSPYMLPHLADRPLTMIRLPDGITGERFFQKHWDAKRPSFVETITLFSESKSENQGYILCNNVPTLLWLGQVGTLEFHVWHSRAAADPHGATLSMNFTDSVKNIDHSILNFPDHLTFDIDPYIYSGKEAKGAEPELNTKAFEKGKQVAFWLRELLDSLKLQSFVKTSGKTGLHVFVPIARRLDFDSVRAVCETLGRHILRAHPNDITMEWSVAKRSGKIFIDYNMNVRGKTLNSAYSPRALPSAAVSMPLTWDELAAAHPNDFRMWNIFERLEQRGDAWAEILRAKQDVQSALQIAPG